MMQFGFEKEKRVKQNGPKNPQQKYIMTSNRRL